LRTPRPDRCRCRSRGPRDQRILDLEFADQRQFDHVPLAAMFEHKPLCKAFDGGLDQTDTLACAVRVAADRDDAQIFERAASITSWEQS